MKTTIAGLSLIVAALSGVVAAVPAPAMAADLTVNLTLNCTGICTGSWHWYQGGTSGTLLSSGSITGTTQSTTVQPATADTVVMVLEQEAGKEPCGVSQTDSFFPGSPIDFTLKLKEKADAYHTGCFDTFNMKS
jgi:hypothetical protein